MSYDAKRSTFDELVAGISAEERRQLLNNINQNKEQEILILQPEKEYESFSVLDTKYKDEPFIYKIILWIRSVFTKKSTMTIYNEDLISSLAKKINKNHPGIIDLSSDLLQSLFYEKLKDLKNAADFFKPYFAPINDNPGKFYVFLSTFVAPEISEKINAEADPYTIPFDRDSTNELRTSLLKRMDNILKTISESSKTKLYGAIKNLTWLKQFSELPFVHFTSQFTAIISANYTCPYLNAQTDYEAFARILQNINPISKESLESMFLFTQRDNLKHNTTNEDITKSLREFMQKAILSFSSIQMFVSTIPIASLGKVIFDDYEWQPKSAGGGEDWFVKFRDEWKNVFNARWLSWLHDKKKNQLSEVLKEQFGLDSFPELENKPWKTLWGGIPFHCEMTAGILAWFTEYKSSEVMDCLNTVILEGIFINKDNRTMLADAINNLSDVTQQINAFVASLTPDGSMGNTFKKYEEERIHTIKAQQMVHSMVVNAESKIRSCAALFCNATRDIEKVFNGILDDTQKDKEFSSLQNLMTIRGHDNKEFRDSMRQTAQTLKIMREVLTEIEPLDMPDA